MHRIIDTFARGFALLGGIVLSLLIVLVCVSVLGRSIGYGPINGDFEIVEAGMAFSIFAFLPLCQLHGAHASVDIFMARIPQRISLTARALTEVMFAAVLILVAWQLCEGALSKFRTGQTTLMLQFPVWWSYAASVVAMSVAAIVGVYVAVMRCAVVVGGVRGMPESVD